MFVCSIFSTQASHRYFYEGIPFTFFHKQTMGFNRFESRKIENDHQANLDPTGGAIVACLVFIICCVLCVVKHSGILCNNNLFWLLFLK